MVRKTLFILMLILPATVMAKTSWTRVNGTAAIDHESLISFCALVHMICSLP